MGERSGEKNGLAAAVAITLAEQDELVAAADRETPTDLLGQPVEERGPGRPKGSLNRMTRKEVAAIRASGQSPLAYLASVWRDPAASPKRRDDCAKAALPYFHKKQPIDVNQGVSGLRVAIILPGQDDQALDFLELSEEEGEYLEIKENQ